VARSDRGMPTSRLPAPVRLVVVGNGMVGHRLLTELASRGALAHLHVTVIGAEPRPAYDRVALSSFFDGRSADDLSLVDGEFFADHGIDLVLGDEVTAIDRSGRVVATASGLTIPYDRLVLATGSYPFVPPLEGGDGPGCFVYRTIEDLEAIAEAAESAPGRRGVVIGGGLLGLEAANALRNLGLDTHVVEFAPRLMPAQLDEGGSRTLRNLIEDLGVHVHTGMRTSAIVSDGERPTAVTFDGADPLPTDLVVFSAGIRPQDTLGRLAGLAVGERGGIVVDDTLATDDPAVLAIGECALVAGRVWGLVAPGYQMARVVAAHLAALAHGEETPEERFVPTDLSTKLKLLGVGVANVGDIAANPDAHSLVWEDPLQGEYRRLDVDADGRVLAAVLIGDTSAYPTLLDHFRRGQSPAEGPGSLILGARPADGATGAGGSRSSLHLVGPRRVEIVVVSTPVDPMPGVEAIQNRDVAEFEDEKDERCHRGCEHQVAGSGQHRHRCDGPDRRGGGEPSNHAALGADEKATADEPDPGDDPGDELLGGGRERVDAEGGEGGGSDRDECEGSVPGVLTPRVALPANDSSQESSQRDPAEQLCVVHTSTLGAGRPSGPVDVHAQP
jgi:NADPH-dependent 2,4-dienoyl-CoA reductase/sulfur reductase-like enzyme